MSYMDFITNMTLLCWVTVTAVVAIALAMDRVRYSRLLGPRYVDRAQRARSLRRLAAVLVIVQILGAAALCTLSMLGLFTKVLAGVTAVALVVAIIASAMLWWKWARETDYMERRIGLEALT